jgi:ribosomal protein S18 acetylase RimI-like enzyme
MRNSRSSSLSIDRDRLFEIAADEWLGERLGTRCWRVSPSNEGVALDSLGSKGACFAYAKVPVAEIGLVRDLIGHGFYPVDVALQFEGVVQPAPAGSGIRFAAPADRDGVARVAGATFEFSRFHLDPAIPRNLANAMKAEWAGNFFVGLRGDGMVVAEVDGRVAGFLQLLWRPQNVLLVDLIGVDRACQGRGIARQLIHFAAQKGTGDGRVPAAIHVGTQVANVKSVRLYESLGLRQASAHYVLHYHGK